MLSPIIKRKSLSDIVKEAYAENRRLAVPLAGFPGEVITEGLDGLRERLAEYYKLGARFRGACRPLTGRRFAN